MLLVKEESFSPIFSPNCNGKMDFTADIQCKNIYRWNLSPLHSIKNLTLALFILGKVVVEEIFPAEALQQEWLFEDMNGCYVMTGGMNRIMLFNWNLKSVPNAKISSSCFGKHQTPKAKF